MILRIFYIFFGRVLGIRLIIFLLGILIFINTDLFSQNYPFREYTALDGLPQSQVISTIQDSRGFLWICTRNGLSRFDGTVFKNYFKKDGLPSNFVNNIIEDSQGNIWTLSNEGLSKYNGFGFDYYPRSPQFKDWTFSFGLTIDSSNNIFMLGPLPGDIIRRLIVFKDGVYSDYTKQFPALDSMNIIVTCTDPRTHDMFLINDQLNLWLWKNNVLSQLSNEKFESLYYDRGNILARTKDRLLKYEKNELKTFVLNSVPGRSEANYKISPDNGEFDFFDGKNSTSISLPFNQIGYMIDNDGLLWFASEKNLYRLLSVAFHSFTEEELGARNIWAIIDDINGHLWFGSLYGDLIEYDGKNFRERNEYKKLFGKGIGFFKGSRRMSNGETWFSASYGVLIWDGITFSRLKGIPDLTQICYIYEDVDNKLVMLGTQRGLYIIRNGNIELMSEFNDNDLGVIEGVTKDETGIYWLSGHRGLVKFDETKKTRVKENVLPDGYTYTIEKDHEGGIWVTSEEGLYFRGKNSETFVHGLPEPINVSANSICLVDSSHILVGRISDICLIDLEKFYGGDPDYYIFFDKTNGFAEADCLDNGIIKTQDGKIWILTSTGVTVFEPGLFKRNLKAPKLHLSGFDYENENLEWEPVERSQFFYGEPEEIILKRLQNTIRISYIGISTTNPEKVKYRHRLIGYDDKWSLPVYEQSAEFEKLPPGKYSFQLFSANADGFENTEPLIINFRVLHAFWETTTFIIIEASLFIILTILATIFITRRIQIKRMERENLNSELSRLQLSMVIKQFDPHFTFNVISSVGSLIMKGEKEIAYDYIIKLSSLLRTILNEGSVVMKSLSGELDFVNRYCELQKLRFKDRLDYVIDVKENIDLQRDIPKMTIQTFVENSIKHGIENKKDGGKIIVTVSNCTGGIEIRIRDNGVGRESAEKHRTGGTGQGMKIISGIFGTMNESNIKKSEIKITDLFDGNKNATGTEVRISIPDGYRFETSNKKRRIRTLN